MTPAARIQAAIEILAALDATQKPADRFLRDWFRSRRYAGSKDRAAVAERVFSVLRHRASLAWRMKSEASRALAIASLLHEGLAASDVEHLFNGEGYGPALLDLAEREAIATPPRGESPFHVRGEFPAWLEPELRRVFGDDLLEETRALTVRASIDLRVNILIADRNDVLLRLQSDGYEAESTPFAPYGVRLSWGEGAAALSRHPLYLSGAFEFQDEAAQIASHLCGAQPGHRVLDLAAGAGGKSLALVAIMQSQGEIVACDVRADALEQLETRAARAGATIIRTHLGGPPEGEFDIVVVDAPCSGSGTWRRQPELKWRLTPERLEAFCRTQDELLRRAASHVCKDGRLIYMTCSVLSSENEDRIEQFLAEQKNFAVCAADAVARTMGLGASSTAKRFFIASPHKTATDGFFTAIMERTTERVA